MSKTIVVFGASGTVGQGLIKSFLDQGAGGSKVVGVFRSEESAKKIRARLGNPSEDKFVTIVGKFDSEQSADELQKKVLAKVGSITDVVASIGAFSWKSPLLQQSAEELKQVVYSDKLEPNFLVAKYFLPLIQDREGTSFTFINGGSVYYDPMPNFGHIAIASGALLKLSDVLKAELKDKPVRINDFVISCSVTPWDNPTISPEAATFGCVDNVKMGKALLGVIIHPNAKGVTLKVVPDVLEKLEKTGTL